jgi:hypothetical protein
MSEVAATSLAENMTPAVLTGRVLPCPGRSADLCEPCRAAWWAWLDWTPAPPPIRLDGTGIRNARDIAEAQQRRYDAWRHTVRWEQGHIASLCAKGKHATEEREHD